MAGDIPIQNLYYLFCYAWGHFREGKSLAVGVTAGPDTANLLANVLINGAKRLLRRGLDRNYIAFEEDLRTIRGRISFGNSLKRVLLINGRASCVFDDLSHDVLHNRIIKATIRSLKHTDGIDRSLVKQLQELERHLSGITLIRLQKSDFSRVQLHRNNSFYDLLLKICELVFDCSLPTQNEGRSKFKELSKDEVRLSSVFEEFVRRFYHLEQKQYRVHRTNIDWLVSEASAQDIAYLPLMKTDICLESSNHTIIMDTKYYRNTFVENYEGKKIKSSDLYQLYSYLKNSEAGQPVHRQLSGILLYPTTDADVLLTYKLGSHEVKVATVDLSTNWQKIHDRLIWLLAQMSLVGRT